MALLVLNKSPKIRVFVTLISQPIDLDENVILLCRQVQGKHDYSEILEMSDIHHDAQTLDKQIANLETELSAARTLQESFLNGSPVSEEYKSSEPTGRRKYLIYGDREEKQSLISNFNMYSIDYTRKGTLAQRCCSISVRFTTSEQEKEGKKSQPFEIEGVFTGIVSGYANKNIYVLLESAIDENRSLFKKARTVTSGMKRASNEWNVTVEDAGAFLKELSMILTSEIPPIFQQGYPDESHPLIVSVILGSNQNNIPCPVQ
ncbi:hypothetical protein EJB05_50954, partial [Eragrostis curvula]